MCFNLIMMSKGILMVTTKNTHNGKKHTHMHTCQIHPLSLIRVIANSLWREQYKFPIISAIILSVRAQQWLPAWAPALKADSSFIAESGKAVTELKKVRWAGGRDESWSQSGKTCIFVTWVLHGLTGCC